MTSKTNDSEKVINTICMDHCTNACMLRVHVKDGKVTRIETDDGGPGLNSGHASKDAPIGNYCITLTGFYIRSKEQGSAVKENLSAYPGTKL